MLHCITSSYPSFKEIRFGAGLNVIVAERLSKDKKDTTNSLGKTSLIKIIDFCFGSNIEKHSLFQVEKFQEHSFTIEMTLLKDRISATRKLSDPGKIYLEGNIENLPIKLKLNRDTGEKYVSLENWKTILGYALFNIPLEDKDDKMSFRNLMHYYVRNDDQYGYKDALKIIPQQTMAKLNICLTFLIGLNYKLAQEWEKTVKAEKRAKEIKKSITYLYESTGKIETKIVNTETMIKEKQERLSNFKVAKEYHSRQKQADVLTKELHILARQNMVDNSKLRLYREAIEKETPPDIEELADVYKEMNLVFSNKLKKHLKEANNFHVSIIEDRGAFLDSEIHEIKSRIKQREKKITEKDNERRYLVRFLETHGALEEFSELQKGVSDLEGKLKHLYEKVRDLKTADSLLEIANDERNNLHKKAKLDYEENKNLRAKSIQLFNENTAALYERKREGQFIIDLDKNGYKFSVKITGGDGGGISKMEIFCYDLMNICLQKVLERPVDILIHDSTIYEGVDSQQVALAIEQAAKKAKEHNFQYIMTTNSYRVPHKDFSNDFNFNKHVIHTLHDRDISGSLFGVKF